MFTVKKYAQNEADVDNDSLYDALSDLGEGSPSETSDDFIDVNSQGVGDKPIEIRARAILEGNPGLGEEEFVSKCKEMIGKDFLYRSAADPQIEDVARRIYGEKAES